MRFPKYLKYLHEKPLPRVPLWQPGNPRHRLFLPLYWLRLVKHEKLLPKDTVKFECHWQMSVNDVKEYLEKLYEVPVLDVRVEIKKGEIMKNPRGRASLVPPLDDRKFVFVQLKEGEFEYPDIFGGKDLIEEQKTQAKAMGSLRNKEKNKNIQRLEIGGWFQ
jgi:large subunit ribosomal protein L23